MSKQLHEVCCENVIFLLFVKAPKCQPPGPLGSVALGQNMDISGRSTLKKKGSTLSGWGQLGSSANPSAGGNLNQLRPRLPIRLLRGVHWLLLAH